MADLPPPPIPAECTMAGNDWFPWYFDRLRKSKWWRRASDMARARNVMLWGEAYKAVPAGGLIDDDDELAEAAGFGMDVAAFLIVKAEIMAPWTLCDDGRWYHPTVSEVVLGRWEDTSERRKAAAAKKRAQRDRARNVPPLADNVPHPKPSVPGDTAKKDGDNTPLTRVREEDTIRKILPDASASSSPEGDTSGRKVDPIEWAFAAWNDLARRLKLPVAKTLDAGRRKALKARLSAGTDAWSEALAAVERSAHCRGGGDRGWRADLDFVADPKNFRRLREGFYGDDAPAEAASRSAWLGPPEVRAAVVAATDEPFAIGHLDPCRWRDVPERAVVTHNDFLASRLRDRVGDTLQAIGVEIIVEKEKAA